MQDCVLELVALYVPIQSVWILLQISDVAPGCGSLSREESYHMWSNLGSTPWPSLSGNFSYTCEKEWPSK